MDEQQTNNNLPAGAYAMAGKYDHGKYGRGENMPQDEKHLMLGPTGPVVVSTTVKTQQRAALGGFSPTRLQQAKSFTMLQQPNQQPFEDGGTRWNWRESRAQASTSGLFRCKSACETTQPDKNENENDKEDATIEPRTGCVFRKMTVKRKDPRTYQAEEANTESPQLNQPQLNQPRKLSFNPDQVHHQSVNSPMSSAQQIANFFKEPVHKSHSEGEWAAQWSDKHPI